MNQKTFKSNLEEINNPALQFITPCDNNEQQEHDQTRSTITFETAKPTNMPRRPRREAKSRRVQLLIKPSLYEKIRERAEYDNTSVNDTIHHILNDALNK